MKISNKKRAYKLFKPFSSPPTFHLEVGEFWLELLKKLCSELVIDAIYVTDNKGLVKFCNEESSLGINLFEIGPTLNELKKGKEFVATPIKYRVEDNKLFKFLAVLHEERVYELGISVDI